MSSAKQNTNNSKETKAVATPRLPPGYTGSVSGTDRKAGNGKSKDEWFSVSSSPNEDDVPCDPNADGVMKSPAVTVTDDEKKVLISPAKLKSMIKLAKGPARSSKSGMNKPVLMRTVTSFSSISSSNSANSAVQAITPMNYTDASGIQALFDEARLLSVEMWWRVDSSAAPASAKFAIVGFSPSSDDPLASVAAGLALQQSSGPTGLGLTLNPSPTSTNSLGMHHKVFKVHGPTPALNPSNGSGQIVGGGWFATQDSLVVCGYLLPYIDALGVAGTTNTTFFLRCNLLCRSRT